MLHTKMLLFWAKDRTSEYLYISLNALKPLAPVLDDLLIQLDVAARRQLIR